jgi:hypothetical protein
LNTELDYVVVGLSYYSVVLNFYLGSSGKSKTICYYYLDILFLFGFKALRAFPYGAPLRILGGKLDGCIIYFFFGYF